MRRPRSGSSAPGLVGAPGLGRRPRSPAALAREAVCPPSATVPAALRRVSCAGRRRPDISHRVPGPVALPAPWSRPSAPDSLSGRMRTGVSGTRGRAGCPASRPVAARGVGPQRCRTRWGPGGRAGSHVEAASPGAFLPLGRHTPHSQPPGVSVDGAARAAFLSVAAGAPGRPPSVPSDPHSQEPVSPRLPFVHWLLAASPRAQLRAYDATQVWPCPRRPAPPPRSPAALLQLLTPLGTRFNSDHAAVRRRGRTLQALE